MKRTLGRRRQHIENRHGVNLDQTQHLWRVPWRRFGFDYCGVYLISQLSNWPVKIGMSDCASRRLDQLQTSHWNELTVSAYWICETRAHAKAIEARAHAMLEKEGRRLLGEWFDLDVRKASSIVDFAAQTLGFEARRDLPRNDKHAAVWEYLDREWLKRNRASFGLETLKLLRNQEIRI